MKFYQINIIVFTVFAISLNAKGQKFDPEKYKTDRERQKSQELERESNRKRYLEEQRINEKQNTPATKEKNPQEKIRLTSANSNSSKTILTIDAVLSTIQRPKSSLPVIDVNFPEEPPVSTTIENGQGSYSFSNGDKFTGYWENHQMKSGTYTFANGDYYKGEFKNNRFNGYNTYTTKNKASITSYFDENACTKTIFYQFNDNSGEAFTVKITGRVNYMFNYNGLYVSYIFSNGDVSETFADDNEIFAGFGSYRFKDGNNYSGTFRIVNGVLTGMGTLTDKYHNILAQNLPTDNKAANKPPSAPVKTNVITNPEKKIIPPHKPFKVDNGFVEVTRQDISSISDFNIRQFSFLGIHIGMTRRDFIELIKDYPAEYEVNSKYGSFNADTSSSSMTAEINLIKSDGNKVSLGLISWHFGSNLLDMIILDDEAATLFNGASKNLFTSAVFNNTTEYTKFLTGAPIVNSNYSKQSYSYPKENLEFESYLEALTGKKKFSITLSRR